MSTPDPLYLPELVTRRSVRKTINARAGDNRKKKRIAELLQGYALNVRPDLTKEMVLTTERDSDLEKEFRKGAEDHIQKSLGVPFFVWWLLKPFVMWAIEQLIDDLFTA
jgi:hypothetical protein